MVPASAGACLNRGGRTGLPGAERRGGAPPARVSRLALTNARPGQSRIGAAPNNP